MTAVLGSYSDLASNVNTNSHLGPASGLALVFAFNFASFAAMERPNVGGQSNSFNHCSLYKVTGKRRRGEHRGRPRVP